jgi:hypothetical protein
MTRLVSILAIALAGAAFPPTAAQGAFGLHDFDVSFRSIDGTSAFQAGSHPFVFETALAANLDGDEIDGNLRHLLLDLPPGVVASTVAYPRCTVAAFNELKDGMNDCPLETVMGISASSFEQPGNWITAPIFNLAPAEGALLSLGFRVADAANVVIDVSLSPDPPHNPLAVAREVSGSVDLFGLKLQLWGHPAHVAHDELRGACGVYATTLASGDVSEFEFENKSGEICPVQSSSRPFLTLPTSCDGPLETFYDAISWNGDEDFGVSVTHNGAGDPLGMLGCGSLGFQPAVTAQPTTDAAQTATGLDLSLAFQDEGFVSLAGNAQSQVRELALALPTGMDAGAALSGGAGACSQADLVEEALEDVPGEGCPETSKAGTVEVESALLEDSVEGVVYRAVPFANLAEDSPMALYLVLRDAERGVLVKQAVGLATDPGTGQLIAFAGDIPQLPFKSLQLHLAADGGTLVSPPRCGDYEMTTELAPWADDTLITIPSAFEIVSGPNGGPCPVDGGDPGAGGAGQAPAPSPSVSSPRDVPRSGRSRGRKRSCPKGKRRVRRKGKVRCVKRGHRKSKEGRRHRGGPER